MTSKEFFINRYRELGWEYKNVTLRQAIRVNTPSEKTEALLNRLHAIGMKLEKIPFLSQGYWVCKSNFSAGATSEYLLGFYSIQEAAAQIPVSLFSPLENKIVLDACSAPGGKTVQLAVTMKNTGAVVALDVRKDRLEALGNQLERCHVKNTVVYLLDARRVSELDVKFDRILLDVPCSGNFAGDSKWFDRRTLKDVERNASLQREIMAETAKVLEPGGELVYSTCSLEPEENELNIDWAIRNLDFQVQEISCHGQKGLTDVFSQSLDDSLEKCRRNWPGLTQGFFVCKLKRRNAS